jgi:hypothetical protein
MDELNQPKWERLFDPCNIKSFLEDSLLANAICDKWLLEEWVGKKNIKSSLLIKASGGVLTKN